MNKAANLAIVECGLYVIARVANGVMVAPVKVGISKSSNCRLRTIKTSCSFEIDSFYEFECPDLKWARLIEGEFHRSQVAHRLSGEWFDLNPIEAMRRVCECYRSCVESRIPDKKSRMDILDCAGVFWAEKRFGLLLSHSEGHA